MKKKRLRQAKVLSKKFTKEIERLLGSDEFKKSIEEQLITPLSKFTKRNILFC